MKKAMVYLTALTLAFSALLAGCGEMRGTDGGAAPSAPPMQTALPEAMMPDPGDGVVQNRDGIITEDDNAGGSTSLPRSSAKPNTGGGGLTTDKPSSATR